MIIYKNHESYSGMPDILKVEKDIYIVFRDAKKRRIATHIDPSSHIRMIAVVCTATGNSELITETIDEPGFLEDALTVGAYDPYTGEVTEGIASCDEIAGTDGANDPSINFIDGKFYLNYFTWKTRIFALVPWFTKLEGITVLMSDDGEFWERKKLKGTEGFATSAKIVKFKDKLLLPAYDTRDQTDQAVILISDDDFEHFTFSFIPRGKCMHYQEPALLPLEDRVLAMMRTSDGFLYQSFFDGERWSIPEKTNMFGFPADLIRREDGTIVCVYCDRFGREILYATNDGDISPNKWDEQHIHYVLSMDSGYPSIIDLGDRLFCVYYDRSFGISCIKGAYFLEP